MNRHAMRRLAFGLVAVSGVLVAAPASSQTRPPPTEARQRLERQVRERFEAIIRQELGLDEAGSAALRETMESFMRERRPLAARQQELRRRMRRSATLLDEAEAREVLDALVAVQRAEVDLLAREQEALLEVLSAPQLVRFYTLREQFGERVRELRGGPGAPRRGGGGGPGGDLPGPWPTPGWFPG